MTHTPNPEVQALAAEAARQIKAVTSQCNAEIETIYRQYRAKADAITGTSDSLNACADSQPHPPRIKTIGAFPIMSDYQHSQQWQASPIQGAISRQSPFSAEDEFLLLETLTNCQVQLVEALKVAKRYSRLPDLEVGISDALSGVYEAAAVIVAPKTYLE